MKSAFVQFSESDNQHVIASFGCAQDEKEFPNQGVIGVDDPRWVAYCDGLPERVREFVRSAV